MRWGQVSRTRRGFPAHVRRPGFTVPRPEAVALVTQEEPGPGAIPEPPRPYRIVRRNGAWFVEFLRAGGPGSAS